MRLKLLTFLLLCGNYAPVAGQIYLNEVREPLLCFGLVVEDSTFVLNGIVTRPDTICNVSSHRDRLYTRIDFQGNVVESLRIDNDYCLGASFLEGIKKWNDSTYYQAGWVGNYADSPDVSAQLEVIAYDLSDTITTIQFQQDTSRLTTWHYSDLDDLNRIVGVGLIVDTIGFWIPYVFRVDENFGVTSLATFPKTTTQNQDGLLPASITCGPKGQIAIGVQDYWMQDENDFDGWVIVMDSTGQELWRHRMWTQPGRYDCGPEVFATSDGNYIVAQQRAYEDVAIEPISFNANLIAVKKISPQGVVLWEYEYGNRDTLLPSPVNPLYEPNFRPYVIKENSLGELFIGGFNTNWSGVLKLSSNGDSLWYRRIRDREGNHPNDWNHLSQEVNFLNDLELLGDTAILVAGQYQTDPGGAVYPNGAQRNWFALLDQYGCDSVGCQTITITEWPPRLEVSLEVYPNPTRGKLQIKGVEPNQEYRILDLQGRVVSSGWWSGEPLELEHRAAGPYLLEIEGKRVLFLKE